MIRNWSTNYNTQKVQKGDSYVAGIPNCDYNTACQSPAGWHNSGRGAARLARLHGVQEVGGSNPLAPTKDRLHNRISDVSGLCFWLF